MATTHPASSPALSRLRTVWPSQTLMRRSCSSLSTDLLPRFVLAGLFEVPGCSLVNLLLALTVTADPVPIFPRHCCPHNQSGCKFQPLVNNESRLPGVVAFQELNFCAVPLKADDKD